MIIGTVKELMEDETRVALTPSGVKELVKSGNVVLVEKGSGTRSRLSDREYIEAGAKIVSRNEAWKAEMIVKIQRPLKEEYKLIHKGQIIFSHLHLPSAPKELTEIFLNKKVSAVANELVEHEGTLVLQLPFSQIAGRMAVLMASYYLAGHKGGRGKLLSGVPGVPGAKVAIIGAGVVGANAARVAVGLGATVTVLSRDAEKLESLENKYSGRLQTLVNTEYNLLRSIKEADVVISAVMRKGKIAPKVISADMVRIMKKGSIIIDVAIDKGGSVATAHATTHKDPVYERFGVIHYAVENMPAAYPRTSTFAFTNATLPYILSISTRGFLKSIEEDKGLRKSIVTLDGFITSRDLAKALRMGGNYKAMSELV